MRIITQVFLVFLVMCIVAFLCGTGFAQDTTNQDTTKVVAIAGIDTSTFFTAFASLVKDAVQVYHAAAFDKDGDITYRSMYVLHRWNGLVNNEILVPAVGLETDWHESGGIFGGIEALNKKSEKYKNSPVNGIGAIAVEGTTSADKGGWNVLVLLAIQLDITSMTGK